MSAWRSVVGYEGIYEVSDSGEVRSLPRTHVTRSGIQRHVSGRMLRPGVARGYKLVSLYRENVGQTRTIHRLVMAAFVGPLPEGMATRHLNGNALDNHLSNLAYGTFSENESDSIAHGTHFQASKTHCKQGHEFTPENTIKTDTQRRCRACTSEWARRRYLRKKVAA